MPRSSARARGGDITCTRCGETDALSRHAHATRRHRAARERETPARSLLSWRVARRAVVEPPAASRGGGGDDETRPGTMAQSNRAPRRVPRKTVSRVRRTTCARRSIRAFDRVSGAVSLLRRVAPLGRAWSARLVRRARGGVRCGGVRARGAAGRRDTTVGVVCERRPRTTVITAAVVRRGAQAGQGELRGLGARHGGSGPRRDRRARRTRAGRVGGVGLGRVRPAQGVHAGRAHADVDGRRQEGEGDGQGRQGGPGRANERTERTNERTNESRVREQTNDRTNEPSSSPPPRRSPRVGRTRRCAGERTNPPVRSPSVARSVSRRSRERPPPPPPSAVGRASVDGGVRSTRKVCARATRTCRALAVPLPQMSLASFDLVASGFCLACADTSAMPRRTFSFSGGSSRCVVLFAECVCGVTRQSSERKTRLARSRVVVFGGGPTEGFQDPALPGRLGLVQRARRAEREARCRETSAAARGRQRAEAERESERARGGLGGGELTAEGGTRCARSHHRKRGHEGRPRDTTVVPERSGGEDASRGRSSSRRISSLSPGFSPLLASARSAGRRQKGAGAGSRAGARGQGPEEARRQE